MLVLPPATSSAAVPPRPPLGPATALSASNYALTGSRVSHNHHNNSGAQHAGWQSNNGTMMSNASYATQVGLGE